MPWLKVGFSPPFVAAAGGDVGSWLSTWLLKAGSANLVVKLPIVAGLLMASWHHRQLAEATWR